MPPYILNGFTPMSFVESLVGMGVAKITSAALLNIYQPLLSYPM